MDGLGNNSARRVIGGVTVIRDRQSGLQSTVSGANNGAPEGETFIKSTRGRVRQFNDTKGFGFIEIGEGNEAFDAFVHYSNIKQDGFKTLREGQTVELDLYQGEKGKFAKEVFVISESI